jgi:ABC-type branched-subunit amino acid transport system permease subunit
VSALMSKQMLLPARDTRTLLVKWVVALLVPIAVFTFVWSGEEIINAVISPGTAGANLPTDPGTLIQSTIFIALFYLAVIMLAGYLVAADSGRRGMFALWLDVLLFALVPIFVIMNLGLIFGLAVSAIIWLVYFSVRNLIQKTIHYTPPALMQSVTVLDAEQQAVLKSRAIAGSFWFATVFAVIWLVADLVYFFLGSLPVLLLIWAIIRTLLLPVVGYFLGRLAGVIALRRSLSAQRNGNGNGSITGHGTNEAGKRVSRQQQLASLSRTRVREEAKDLVPNDLPLRSSGAQRFYLILLVAFVIFYPILDPFLFGSGTEGRLASYGDLGRYIILALGLNIVVGFAGLLDLGYVAFFAIGAYAWGIVGSTQLTNVLNLAPISPQLLSWLFWPMLLGAALIAAFWGVVLGAPTLRLRGDYLAIVTLGFGEIVPIVFTELDKYTNGTNGIVGVQSPAFFGIDWSIITPAPYYYLILALIALSIFANIRLRDSRLGRAWIAIREDEVAAASSGVNLVNTKLFAFGAGAFFSGISGAFYAAKLGGASPDNFSFNDSIIYLAMVVIGGIGSIPGVIVGAIVVYSINVLILAQLDTWAADPTNVMFYVKSAIIQLIPGFTFGNIRNLLFGIILVAVMIFRPEGLIPSARRRRELHASTEETPELGSMDIVPGTEGFEQEVHVE